MRAKIGLLRYPECLQLDRLRAMQGHDVPSMRSVLTLQAPTFFTLIRSLPSLLILHNTGYPHSLFSSTFSLSLTPVHGCTRIHCEYSVAHRPSFQRFTLSVNHSGFDPLRDRIRTQFDRNFHFLNLFNVRTRGGQLDYPCPDRRSSKLSPRPARTKTSRAGQQAHSRRQWIFRIHS
jgi:hypothetical protein